MLVIWLILFIPYGMLNRRLTILNRWTGEGLAAWLELLGHDTYVKDNTVVWGDGLHRFVIIDECTGMFGVFILAAFVLGVPSPKSWKALGLAVGTVVIVLLNQARLLTMAMVEMFKPSWLQFAHDYVWEVVFVLAIAATFLVWLRGPKSEREALFR